jgi:hypothetical protein
MVLIRHSGILSVPFLMAFSICAHAQQQPEVSSSSSSSSSAPAQPAPVQPAMPRGPSTIEDGGFSIEPFYWLTPMFQQLPDVRGGQSSSYSNADLNFPGVSRNSFGGILSIPTGLQSTIRVSYFRSYGHGSETAPTNLTLLGGTPYSAGDWLVTTWKVQDVKASWDFLTFRIPAGQHKIRIKTLWEAQWLLFAASVNAPYAPVTTNSSGSVVSNDVGESKSLILPTLGGEIEQEPFRHFRYELKADGFGLPHRADIWEAEGSLAFRVGRTELLLGAKAIHFKTSPKADDYFIDTLSGPYVGIRYYLHNPE